MNRRTLLVLTAALHFAGAARAETPAAGRLVLHEAMSSAHAKARNVSIWLPPGYDASDARHPVLYMHDGQNLFDASTANFGEWGVDEHLTRLIAGGQVRAPIVVGVWNTDLRLREYVPADLIAALPDDMRADVQAIYGGPPLSDGYLRFLVEELKPFVDRTYRTLTRPQDTTIAGSSMGGLISLYAVMKRPEVFSAAACLSTHWPLKVEGLEPGPTLDAWRERLVAAWAGVVQRGLPSPGSHRLYFDRGDETLDQFYADFQTHMDGVIRARGYGPDDFRSLVFPGAQHNEASWNQRLDVPLTFLLSPAPTQTS
ncbi:alpha/beta hydrolase-fold protein [Brevundimonas sp.]|uniref:alpha/beta hydrolase n=1 Tax=Brevundimonas sp. TaxID=1871086 RepID=UPI0019B41142|nr:alpha/beta hydrolase-fold protein [Brevundimonas sp.]MBD3836477.1 esterase [Brevundimonas sp.]